MTDLSSLLSGNIAILSCIGLALCIYLAALPRAIPGIPYNRLALFNPLGDALDFLIYSIKHGDMYGLMPARLRQLNSPIMQIFVRPFGQPWIIISDPHVAVEILSRRSKEFDRSTFFGDIFKAIIPESHLHLPTGPEWSAHRRLISDSMSPWFLRDVAGPVFYHSACELVELWKIKARLAQGRPISMRSDISHSALEIVWHATLGSEPGAIQAKSDLLSKKQSDSLPASHDVEVFFPEPKFSATFDAIVALTKSLDIPSTSIAPNQHHRLALWTNPRLRRSLKLKDAFIEEQVSAAKVKVLNLPIHPTTNSTTKPYTSAVELILHREHFLAEKESRPPNYNSRIISDELFTFLFAGHDTTATTLLWGVKFLSNNLSAQTTLRTALQTSHVTAHASQSQPTLEDIMSHDISYLDAVLAELNRKAMVTVAVSRTATVDTTIMGYAVPKGTNVFLLNSGPGIQTPAIRTGKEKKTEGKVLAWNDDDIAEFKPERWLKTGDKGEVVFDASAGPSLPFGAGARACFGRKWAQLELRVILTLMVWNFEFLPPPPELNSFGAVDRVSHRPRQCFARLVEVTL